MTLLLVRHAHAGRRGEWSGDDLLRPLSSRGMIQAFGIADLLEAWHPTRIVSSPAVRCRQTVEVLSGRLGVPIEVDDRLFEATSVDENQAVVDAIAADVAVLCSHGDVIPALLQRLASSHGLELVDDFVWAKGSTWVLERDATGRFGTGRYLPPPDRMAETVA